MAKVFDHLRTLQQQADGFPADAVKSVVPVADAVAAAADPKPAALAVVLVAARLDAVADTVMDEVAEAVSSFDVFEMSMRWGLSGAKKDPGSRSEGA